jgi:Ca2+-transporting ATPase
MLTGDSPVTARSIAAQAGLGWGDVATGPELEAMPLPQLTELVAKVSVFARVMPQQKLQLVRALQAAGEVVAMTGDGVNDAAALKAADIGVAMGKRGTAVARESADLVLLNDSFGDLVAALAMGRRIDSNLHRALAYTLAIHLPIAALSLIPLLIPGQSLILLPVHIALLHLVIDPACTVVFEAIPAAPALMDQPPRPPGAPLFDAPTWQHATWQGLALMAGVLAMAFWPHTAAETQRSMVVGVLLLSGGGLVWINGGRFITITAAGAALGAALWLALLLSAPLQRSLALTALSPVQAMAVVLATGLALLVATGVRQRYADPRQG